MQIETFLSRLDRVRHSGSGWSTRCPAHDDKRNSLSVDEGENGGIIVKCFAGCSAESIVTALRLTLADLMPERTEKKRRRWIANTYDYRDADGTLLSQVVRYDPKDFRQRRPDGKDGWTWNLDGVKPVLYRLPELQANSRRWVFVVEGEKDAERLTKLGFLATTNPGGVGKWRSEFSDALRGRYVAIIPDNDEPGRKHAEQVARSIHGVAATVRIIALPGLPAKGDVSNWLDSGGTESALKEQVRRAPEWSPDHALTENAGQAVTVALSEVTPESVEWLWPGRIPFGKLTVLDGDPGLGKSLITLDLAARLSAGKELPDRFHPETAQVLILSAEDGPGDTILPRLLAAGGDPNRVHLYKATRTAEAEEFPSLARDVDALEETVRRHSIRLVVIDPLVAYLGPGVNSWKDQEVRRVLAPLSVMADRARTALLLVRHLTKNEARAIYRGGGSIGISGAARAVLLVAKDPDDETRQILAPVKCNLSKPPIPLAYRIEPNTNDVPVIAWGGPVQTTADRLLAPEREHREKRTARDEAAEALQELLSDGPKPEPEIRSELEKRRVSEATYKRARYVLGVRSIKDGFGGGWLLSLPEGDQPEPKGITPGIETLRSGDDLLRSQEETVAGAEEELF